MTPSPLQLTEEQKHRIYNQRAERFMEGMKKLTDETGLILIPVINYTEHANELVFQLVEAPQKRINNDNQKTS